jgi:hypothetical protein
LRLETVSRFGINFGTILSAERACHDAKRRKFRQRYSRGGNDMKTKLLGYASVAAATLAGVGLGAWLFGGPPARALEDAAQIITGGGSAGGTIFMVPSGSQYGPDSPGPGLGESSASVPFPSGTLSKLRVNLTTGNVPTGGSLTVMVRVNGADTNLTCTLTASGICTSGNKAKALNNNALVALRVVSDLTDAGGQNLTYSLQLD